MDGQGAPELAPSKVARRRDSMVEPGLIGDIRRTIRGARRHVHHSHPDLEFNLVVRGTGSYVVQEEVHELRPGTLMWITPNRPHWLRRGPGLEMWVVQIRPSALLEPAWLTDVAARPSRIIASHDLIDLDRLMSQVVLDSDEPAAYNAGINYVLMRALRASRDRPQAALREMHPAVTRALMLMRQSDNITSLSDLAEEAGVAPTYLSRLLMEHTGRNFVDWRNRIRLDRFIETYQPGMNLLTAALDAGFGSYARFHHVFSELVGCPPSEWLNQVDAGKILPKAGASAPLPGYGVPSGGLLSARQRWTTLAKMVSPAIRKLIGGDFADRLTTATRGERSSHWRPYDHMDMRLTPEDIERLIASFHDQDPEIAADYGRMAGAHDFAAIYERTCADYAVSAEHLSELITAILLISWLAAKDLQITLAQVEGIRRQVESTLEPLLPQLARTTVREGRVAMQCHFAIMYLASTIGRASGDPRQSEQLDAVAREWSAAVFGRNIRDFEVTLDGFVPPSANLSSSRRTARRSTGLPAVATQDSNLRL
jgi:AraC-like DNA-binding protein